MTQRHSAVYEGFVSHHRRAPVDHEFRYAHAMLLLDLAELPEAFDCHPLWSARRRAPARFARSDYLGDPAVGLDNAVRELVSEKLGERPDGPIRLLTNVRMLGHCFNPVSFYYCYRGDGRGLRAVVAQVTNTPWGERHCYVMDAQGGGAPGSILCQSFDKVFHVSPFMGMDHRYEWRMTEPGDQLVAHIESHHAGERVFDATLSLRRRALDRAALTRLLLRYPATTLRVSARIYGQAVRLKLKGAPYHPHPRRKAA
jgi:uncharacterized protein